MESMGDRPVGDSGPRRRSLLGEPYCPECGSLDVDFSRSTGPTENLVRTLLPFQYYRCVACGTRIRQLNSESFQAWTRMLRDHIVVVLVVLLFLTGAAYFGVRVLARSSFEPEEWQKGPPEKPTKVNRKVRQQEQQPPEQPAQPATGQ